MSVSVFVCVFVCACLCVCKESGVCVFASCYKSCHSCFRAVAKLRFLCFSHNSLYISWLSTQYAHVLFAFYFRVCVGRKSEKKRSE